jgi:hypothetical protein
MKCPYCGAENDDNEYVCSACGMPLKRSRPHESSNQDQNDDDFFEFDMYDEGSETDDANNDFMNDETISVNEDTMFYEKEASDNEPFEENEAPHNESFSFDEDDDDEEEEEPYEDVIQKESKLDAFKNAVQEKIASFKDKRAAKKAADEDYDDEEAEEAYEDEEPVTTKPGAKAASAVKSFFLDDDEEDVETDQSREDNLEDVYEDSQPRRRTSSIRIIPFKVLMLVLVVACVVGGILMMRNKSSKSTTKSSETSSSTSSSTSSVSSTPTIASVKASSTLQETGYDHSASLMIDNNLKTAWQEGVSGSGIGEYATFTLESKSKVKSCKIANGYDKTYYLYRRNNRVKRVTFTFDDGTTETYTLSDTYNAYQMVTFKKTHTTKMVKITINSVYRGTYYNDTCISELKFA